MSKPLHIILLIFGLASSLNANSLVHQQDHRVPAEALNFNAAVTLTNFDSTQEEKVQRAVEMIKRVVRSGAFKDRIINFSFNNRRQFNDNRGLDNQKIYQMLIGGSELTSPGVDYKMDLDLELYYSSKNTVGHTYPKKPRIYINSKYFNKFTIAEVAGNVFHEWSHKLGFDHSKYSNSSRPYSVPYGLGSIMVELVSLELAAEPARP